LGREIGSKKDMKIAAIATYPVTMATAASEAKGILPWGDGDWTLLDPVKARPPMWVRA
jgi:hypothetical protein